MIRRLLTMLTGRRCDFGTAAGIGCLRRARWKGGRWRPWGSDGAWHHYAWCDRHRGPEHTEPIAGGGTEVHP